MIVTFMSKCVRSSGHACLVLCNMTHHMRFCEQLKLLQKVLIKRKGYKTLIYTLLRDAALLFSNIRSFLFGTCSCCPLVHHLLML